MAFADIEILGNLGGDPEMRYTPNGSPVTNFNVAVNHSRPDGAGGWQDLGTNWFRVATFGDAAERQAETLKKGDRVLVKGRFHAREFDRQDGSKGTSLDIVSTKVVTPRPMPGRHPRRTVPRTSTTFPSKSTRSQ
jgi:single-strand DNA-binding protein